jgi:hypothetical protein
VDLVMLSDLDAFEMACRAFALFTDAERLRALERFAGLRYPSIRERFIDAVHFVIVEWDAARERRS